MGLLSGKTAIITGATRGIGLGIAKRFAQEGANIAFTYQSSPEKAETVEKAIAAEFGVKVKSYQSNAGVLAECESLIADVISTFGGLHIIVNNAGITRDNLLMRLTEQDWDAVIETNLKSIFCMTKATQRHFLKQRHGVFINMSSVVGIGGNAGQSNYAASKAGIIGFSKSIAQELGSRNIRTNVVAPGFIETEMTATLPDDVKAKWIADIPLKRGGTPEDVANVCVFLASDLSAYVNGQTISVCGGMQM